MIRQLQWLALLVLSATRKPFKYFSTFGKICIFVIFYYIIIVFTSCGECDCIVAGPCSYDTELPNPRIQFNLFDENNKSWFEWQRGNFIDSIRLYSSTNKELLFRDTSKFANCYKTICFQFNESPGRETVGKFVARKYFLDLHIIGRGWDRDTLLIAYKSDTEECLRDSIDFKYNDFFTFKGTFDNFQNKTIIQKKQ
jgi:hypothetical protein